MRELDDDGRRDDAWLGGLPELRRQQHEQRPEPLAAGVDEVPRGLGDERVRRLHRVAEQPLDGLQASQQLGLERMVGHRDAEGAGQRRKTPACSARSMTGCGKRPRTTLITVTIEIALTVSPLGMATVGPSGAGSAKNISTMTRT